MSYGNDRRLKALDEATQKLHSLHLICCYWEGERLKAQPEYFTSDEYKTRDEPLRLSLEDMMATLDKVRLWMD